MHKDLLYLISSHLTDRDRLTLKLYCHTVYFKFIDDFKLCCINNAIISIKILLLTNNKLNWKGGLEYACRGGACVAGGRCPHCDIVNLMMCSKLGIGANYWNWGLVYACMSDHSDIVKLMISKGATLCMHCRRNMDDHLI